MPKKMLWGGRFGSAPSSEIMGFNSAESIELDKALIPYDILGSLAHVRMLNQQKILDAASHGAISAALKKIYAEWEGGKFVLRKELEDVHMNIEDAVTALTPEGKKMHTARSRNDQVLLDMRLYMRDEALTIIDAVGMFMEALANLSKKDGPMAAYTHTRVAQPITISFWCDAWIRSFGRDVERLEEAYKRINQNPLGSCAIAGTAWDIDRSYTAKLLSFDSVQENALDAISSRGECEAELLSIFSLIMCKLSRMSEELIWLSEKGLVQLAEEHTTGSSIMPNKKNPDALELIRGRTARVYGCLDHCLIALKGIPGGYNSDMQETKYAIMMGVQTTRSCIEAMKEIVSGIVFDNKKIEEELDQGFAQATEIADHLAMHGMPFREAHEKVGNLVKICEKEGKTFSDLERKRACDLLGMDIPEARWKELIGFERDRLKRKIKVEKSDFPETERKKIKNAYAKLL